MPTIYRIMTDEWEPSTVATFSCREYAEREISARGDGEPLVIQTENLNPCPLFDAIHAAEQMLWTLPGSHAGIIAGLFAKHRQ